MKLQMETNKPAWKEWQDETNMVTFKYICPNCGWKGAYVVDGEGTINVRKTIKCVNSNGCGKSIVLELIASAVCDDDQKKSV